MAGYFPVARSLLDLESLRALVGSWWELGRVVAFELDASGLEDDWILADNRGRRYSVHVWRSGAKVEPDILYGLEALGHLAVKGLAVARPLPRKDGEPLTLLRCPEGERALALFSRAHGRPLDAEDEIEAFRYGRAAAVLHIAGADFRPRAERRAIDLERLLSRPLESLVPLLASRHGDRDLVHALAASLRSRIEALPLSALERGFCHGDLDGRDAILTPEGQVELRGFSHCGSSWLAWDLSAFRHARLAALLPARGDTGEEAGPLPIDGPWAAFLRGYGELRTLGPVDLEAIPLFACVRQLVVMARDADRARFLGSSRIAPPWLDRNLALLRALDAVST